MEHSDKNSTTTNTVTEPKEELIPASRYKNLQADYTKKAQELAKLKAEREEILGLVTPNVALSVEDKERLEELKLEDPDKWYEEKQRLENKAKEELSTKLSAAQEKANAASEIARREALLNSSGLSVEDLELLPMKYHKQLEDGSLTFEDYLQEALKLKQGTIDNSTPPDVGSLNQTGTPIPDNSDSDYKDLVL